MAIPPTQSGPRFTATVGSVVYTAAQAPRPAPRPAPVKQPEEYTYTRPMMIGNDIYFVPERGVRGDARDANTQELVNSVGNFFKWLFGA